MNEAFDAALGRGIERFNHGDYWHAHEEWESIWLSDRGESRDFLQGLIQLAAAWYHVGKKNWRGATRLFVAALARLERYPAGYLGLDREAAVIAARDDLATLSSGGVVSPRPVSLRRMQPS